jgi:hypothetical protein
MRPARVSARHVRFAIWSAFAVVYALVGSLAPFVLLLGWWEAVPSVFVAILIADRVSRRFPEA